jgi:hypothetical protein
VCLGFDGGLLADANSGGRMLNEATPGDQPDLTDKELAFFRAMVWEVVHLEMKGPAHSLALEQGYTRPEMMRLWMACGTRFKPEMYSEERPPHLVWPWLGQTPADPRSSWSVKEEVESMRPTSSTPMVRSEDRETTIVEFPRRTGVPTVTRRTRTVVHISDEQVAKMTELLQEVCRAMEQIAELWGQITEYRGKTRCLKQTPNAHTQVNEKQPKRK